MNRVASNHEAEDVAGVPGGLVTGQTMPVEHAVHWKPLRDAHYILASLQPSDGGRRKIFIRQRVLARVQSLVRSGHGRGVAGILLGEFCRCRETGTDYEVIDSLFALSNAGAEDILGTVKRGLSAAKQRHAAEVIGWYTSAPTLEFKLSSSLAAVHRSYFQEPYQTTLVITGGTSTSDGAFFLYDDAAARWFYAPFYELPEEMPAARQPKHTCVSWPQYMTVDEVVQAKLDELITTAGADSSAPNGWEDHAAAPCIPAHDCHVQLTAAVEPTAPQVQPPAPVAGDPIADPDPVSLDAPAPVPNDRRVTATGPTAEIPLERGADVGSADTPKEAPAEKIPFVDDQPDRSAGLRSALRRATVADGEIGRNDADRFLEQARSEGFVVVATFASVAKIKRTETLWVLADPSAGVLLTIVTTSARVVDAALHYNLHTDDPKILRHAFPEHRDLASQTIYLRETCLDDLSTRCSRLRETTALERTWMVSPTLYLLTPGEWQSFTGSTNARPQAARVQMLNRDRISALPDAIRNQFGLEMSS